MSGSELTPIGSSEDQRLEVIAHLVSVVPGIGGIVSNVLNGIGLQRKMERIDEVLKLFTLQLEETQRDITSKIEQDDFEEILEKTLRAVAEERSESKRLAYARFLASTVKAPEISYDEKEKHLKTLEGLSPDGLILLKALLEPPNPNPGYSIGSVFRTIQERVQGISREKLDESSSDLVRLGLTSELSHGNMTAQGAQDLRHAVSAYGKRFVEFVLQ